MQSYSKEDVPIIEEAIAILNEAKALNPGGWIKHSKYVAEAAKLIAEQIDGIDSELAYILGLLHDIGRRYGIFGMRHGIDGFNYASSKGLDLVARICLSHIGFKHDNKVKVVGKWDGSDKEYNFAKEYLSSIEDTDYDKLIKLCDCLSSPNTCIYQ